MGSGAAGAAGSAVHRGMPTDIYHDTTKGVLWSPDGLGADDRAGVYSTLAVLASGARPHVLWTDEEETGGQGAESAAAALVAPPVNLMVQLDRRGSNDAVWYSCDNKRARKWVNRHGYQTATGSFSDISILMPEWRIAGVNLSVGYYDQHTTGEYLIIPEMMATVRKVIAMCAAPPAKRFDYRRPLTRIVGTITIVRTPHG